MWADIFTDFERRETLGRAMMMVVSIDGPQGVLGGATPPPET